MYWPCDLIKLSDALYHYFDLDLYLHISPTCIEHLLLAVRGSVEVVENVYPKGRLKFEMKRWVCRCKAP